MTNLVDPVLNDFLASASKLTPDQMAVIRGLIGAADGSNVPYPLTAAKIGGLTASNNLSDLNNASTARTNLGSTTVGDALFVAANVAAARTALGASVYKVASNQNFTSTTATDVTGMSHTMAENSLYRIDGQIQYTSDTGGILAWLESTAVLSGTAGNGHGISVGSTGLIAGISYNVAVANGYLLYQESSARTGRPISFWLVVASDGSGGTIKMVARKNAATGADTVILPQTWMRIEKIA